MKTGWLVCVGIVTMVAAAVLVGPAAAQDQPAAGGAVAAAEGLPPACDVLIVWSAGTPDAPPLPGVDAGAVDAITQATAASGNIQQTAQALGKELEATGHTVIILTAEECRDPRYVTQAKALVLGCPSYFSLPPWEMVRFVDETLYRLYRARVRLDDHVVTSFATTQPCQDVLTGILRSTRGKAVEGAIITPRGTSEADREATIKQLAERIAAGL